MIENHKRQLQKNLLKPGLAVLFCAGLLCHAFAPLVSSAEGFSTAIDDPYCDPYLMMPCSTGPSFEEKQKDMLALPSALDQEGVLKPDSSSSEHTTKQRIMEMKYVQELHLQPNTYWAFETAAQGDEAYKLFEHFIKTGEIKRDLLRIIGNVGIKLPGPFGIRLPPFDTLESLKGLSKKGLSYYKPKPGHVTKRAGQLSQLYLLCSGEGFDCPAFHEHFKNKDTDIDTQALAQNLNKALAFAKKNSPEFPVAKDLNTLSNLYPDESNAVVGFQNSKDIGRLEDQMEFMQNIVMFHDNQIGPVSFSSQGSNASSKSSPYLQEAKRIDQILLSEKENLSDDQIKKLMNQKRGFQKQSAQLQKKKALMKHHQDSARALAWVQAVNTIAVAAGMPKEVIKVGQAVEQTVKIYKAAKGMLLAAAVDPTGITAIASAVGVLMKLFSNTPSHEEIVQKKLNQLIKGQQKILSQLAKMDQKIDQISRHLYYITDLTKKNHQEVIAHFSEITKHLNTIQLDIKYGFSNLISKDEQTAHNAMMRDVYGQRQGLALYQDNKIDNTVLADSYAQLGVLARYSEDLAAQTPPVDFAALSKEDIQKYLEDPVVEHRAPFFASMTAWLNNTKEREKYYFKEKFLKQLKYAVLTHNEADYQKLAEKLAAKSYDTFKKASFGPPIPELPAPQDLMHARFQDEVLMEYVHLASLLPPLTDRLGSIQKDSHIGALCRRASSAAAASQIMREHLQTAWNIYMFYFFQVQKQVLTFYDYTPFVSVYLKTTGAKPKQAVRFYGQLVQRNRTLYAEAARQPIFHNGRFSSQEILDEITTYFGEIKPSEFFSSFDQKALAVVYKILKGWTLAMVQSYGYIKSTPKLQNGQRVMVYSGDDQRFASAQVRYWSWYPRHVYFSILHHLDKGQLFANWQKAYLALDTMARAGYGRELSFHPELSVFNKLLAKMAPSPPPVLLPAGFNPKKPNYYQAFSPSERSQVVDFFKHIEIFSDPAVDIAAGYADSLKNRAELKSAEGLINKKYMPKCETRLERAAVSAANARKLIHFMQSLVQQKGHHSLNEAVEVDQVISYLQTEVLNRVIQNETPIHFKPLLQQKTHFKPALDFVNQKGNYQDWKYPLCEDILQNPKKWNQAIALKRSHNPTYKISFVIPLPDPSASAFAEAGLGDISLRQGALFKASLYEQFENCPFKTFNLTN